MKTNVKNKIDSLHFFWKQKLYYSIYVFQLYYTDIFFLEKEQPPLFGIDLNRFSEKLKLKNVIRFSVLVNNLP